MRARFHLSIPVPRLDESVAFFTLLGGAVTYREAAYVNLDLHGTQLTLSAGDAGQGGPSAFHFGLNLSPADFGATAARLQASPLARVVSPPQTADAGTALERRKMYVRCPAGYLIELKTISS